MDLAPLNFDRYFKRVFSDLNIAKRFLEDFLDTTIEEIEALSLPHKVTDKAMIVEFDFRCKIEGKYITIDMQQWYKDNVIERFYLYHCTHSVLQLEQMPSRVVKIRGKDKKVKDYKNLLPSITIIWMVHDSLNTSQDRLDFRLYPHDVAEFIEQAKYWADWEVAQKQRKYLLQLLQNQTKNLHFLQTNRLLFAFQDRIVRNKSTAKYARWFEFAKKTGNTKNKINDFKEYEEDPIFAEVIRKLDIRKAEPTTYSIIDNYFLFEQQKQLFEERMQQQKEQMRRKEEQMQQQEKQRQEVLMIAKKHKVAAEQERAKAEQERAKAEQERAKAEQERAKAEQERAKAEQEKIARQKVEQQLLLTAQHLKQQGLSVTQIAAITQLSEEVIRQLPNQA